MEWSHLECGLVARFLFVFSHSSMLYSRESLCSLTVAQPFHFPTVPDPPWHPQSVDKLSSQSTATIPVASRGDKCMTAGHHKCV